MKLLTEKIENSQAILQMEVEAEELDVSMEEAYRRLLPRVSIPGFRKGRAPRSLVEQHVGKGTLLQEALAQLIPHALDKMLKSRSLEAITEPEIKVIQTDPVTVEAVVSLYPTVKLGDYKGIRLEPEPVEFGGDNIEAVMNQAREQQGSRVPVERPVQYGDLLTVSIEGTTEGKTFLKHKDISYEVIKDSPVPLPGFAERLVSMEKNKEQSFRLSFPPDHEVKELAGKEFSFKVNISEIKERKLPELNDEFAKSLGHENLDSMREHVRAQLKVRTEELSRRRFEHKMIEAVAQLCEVNYPPILVEREIDRLLDEEASNFKDGIKGLEAYLKNVSKTPAEHREELRPIAIRRLVEALVLDKIAKEEKLEVSTGEIEEEISKLTKEAGSQGEELQKVLASPQVRHSIEHHLLNRKTIDRLVDIAEGKV